MSNKDYEMPFTLENVSGVVKLLVGKTLGRHPDGGIDVVFADASTACSFVDVVKFYGWSADIREHDSVSSLFQSVTLTVREAEGA